MIVDNARTATVQVLPGLRVVELQVLVPNSKLVEFDNVVVIVAEVAVPVFVSVNVV